jgi:hypothetical protein
MHFFCTHTITMRDSSEKETDLARKTTDIHNFDF